VIESSAFPSLLVRLLDRLQEKEALDLEFKSAKGGLPKAIWPTISAFANTQGGWIVLGVDEQQNPPVIGVTNPDRMLQNLFDSLRDS
jgi:ATP-dependent DNA helicase RecG